MEPGYTNAKPLSLAPEHVAGAVAEAVPGAHDAKVTTMCAEVDAAGPLAIADRSLVNDTCCVPRSQEYPVYGALHRADRHAKVYP